MSRLNDSRMIRPHELSGNKKSASNRLNQTVDHRRSRKNDLDSDINDRSMFDVDISLHQGKNGVITPAKVVKQQSEEKHARTMQKEQVNELKQSAAQLPSNQRLNQSAKAQDLKSM